MSFAVTSSHRHAKHFPLPAPPRRWRGDRGSATGVAAGHARPASAPAGRERAGAAAGALDRRRRRRRPQALRRRRRRRHAASARPPAPRRNRAAPACIASDAAGDWPAGDQHEIAREDALAPHRRRARARAVTRSPVRARRRSRGPEDLDAGACPRTRVRRSATATIPTPRPRSAAAASRPRSSTVASTARRTGRDGVEGGEPQRALGEHDAGQVVPGEDERLPDRARGDHVARARTWCSVSPCQTGTMPVEVAERRGAGEVSTPAARACAASARARSCRRPVGEQRARPARAPRRRARRRHPAPRRPQPPPRAPRRRRRRRARQRGGGDSRVAHSRSSWCSRSRPSPAALRRICS